MAVHFNESTVTAEPFGVNVRRQRLLTDARVKGTNILLDRWTLGSAALAEIEVPAGSLAWFQMLDGQAALRRADGAENLTETHIVFLPPRFRGTLASEGATLLYAEVPDAGRFDTEFAANPPGLRVVDWMIIYPPGTRASNHHHEGAEHFMYLTRGRGTAHANEQPFPVRKGDLVYYADRERHYFISEGDEDMVFIEFFVPAEYKTIWAKDEPSCKWLPTGRSMRGTKPVREIEAHGGADAVQDV